MTTRCSRRVLLGGAWATLGATLGNGLAGCAPSKRPEDATLWYSYGGKNREVLLALVERFHAQQSEHRVVPTYQGDYFELLAKLRTAMHAGVVPAVTHVVGEVLPYLAEARVLLPLGELGLDDADLVPQLAQRGTFASPTGPGAGPPLLYGLPFNRSTPIAYLNGHVLQKLGVEAPRTWEALRTFAARATSGDGGERRYGFGCPIDWWFWVALLGQAGGEIEDATGRVTLGYAAGDRALGLWRTLVVDDRSMRPPPGRDYNAWQVVNSDFLAQRTAMVWTSSAFLRYIEGNAKFPVVVAPLPRGERHSVPTGGTFFVVPRAAPRSEHAAAAAFLRFMMEPEQANHFATSTGYIPVSATGVAALERAGRYREHPSDRVALAQLADASPWPWSPRLFRIQREIVQPRLEAAIVGRRDVAEVLAEARALAAEDAG